MQLSRSLWVILFFATPWGVLFSDIKSSTGNIHIDVNSNGTTEATISNTGLGLGTTTPSSNLHVIGNAVVENGNIGIATTATNSTLEINGSFGLSVESVSANATISANSIVLADTSSDNLLITLPYAGNVSGRSVTIKKISQNNKLWIAGGGNTIDTFGSIEMSNSNTSLAHLQVVSNGTQWYILSDDGGLGNVASDNMIGWWKFDESNGTTAVDATGTSGDGTLDQGLSFSGCSTTGKLLNALDFDGSDDRVDVTTITLGASDDFAISMWAKRRDTSTLDGLIKGPATTSLFRLAADTTTVTYRGQNDVLKSYTFTSLPANEWNHIFLNRRGSSVRCYANGVESSSGALTDSGNFQVARFGDAHTGNPFIGALDDIRIFNRALTEAEIQALYMVGENGD